MPSHELSTVAQIRTICGMRLIANCHSGWIALSKTGMNSASFARSMASVTCNAERHWCRPWSCPTSHESSGVLLHRFLHRARSPREIGRDHHRVNLDASVERHEPRLANRRDLRRIVHVEEDHAAALAVA